MDFGWRLHCMAPVPSGPIGPSGISERGDTTLAAASARTVAADGALEELARSPSPNRAHGQAEAAILRRAIPTRPIIPLPNSQAAAGNGTGAKSKLNVPEFCNLPFKSIKRNEAE